MFALLGMDLDNTIIDYGPAYDLIANDLGLPTNMRTRQTIRTGLRAGDPHDHRWQEFQALLYTNGLALAVPARGALCFMDSALEQGWRIVIVSHKTEHTQERLGGAPLREPATEWLIKHGVVPGRCGFEDLHYEPTQAAKIERIARLSCAVFVDDLASVVFNSRRPSGTRMVQYVPDSAWVESSEPGVAGQGDFGAISEWLRRC